MAARRSPSRRFIRITPDVARPARSEIVSSGVRITMPPAEIIISSSSPVHHPRRRHRPGLGRRADRPHAANTAPLGRVRAQRRALAIPVLGHHQQLRLRHRPRPCWPAGRRRPARMPRTPPADRGGRPQHVHVEPRRLPALGDQDDVVASPAVLDVEQLVAFLEVHRPQPVRAHLRRSPSAATSSPRHSRVAKIRKSLFSKSGAARIAVTFSPGSMLITLISGVPRAVRS